MSKTESLIREIQSTIDQVIATAEDVNKLSHGRKQITSEGLGIVKELYIKNDLTRTNFKKIFKNLNDFISNISQSFEDFQNNISIFESIIDDISAIEKHLESIAVFIMQLISIAEQIQLDTEEIHILATNASIVSSKYHGISSVFEILSDRLNSMSIYINQNIEHIVKLVTPLNNGISNLIKNNSSVKSEISNGLTNFNRFYGLLNDQIKHINELLGNVSVSESKIDSQKQKFNEINGNVQQMDVDSDGAINGSGKVKEMGEKLLKAVIALSSDDRYVNFVPGSDSTILKNKVIYIKEQGEIIWKTAQNVNTKSISQLEFSNSCLEFCDSIIADSTDLKETTIDFNSQSVKNSEITKNIILGIKKLSDQLDGIKDKITSSNNSFKQFGKDYMKIADILTILENILKSMKSIGLYSKIEASRNPVEFQGFLTISNNIQKLQDNISGTLPDIQGNINNTKALLKSVNTSFDKIYNEFNNIQESSVTIVNNFSEISTVSANTESMSNEIVDISNIQEDFLNNLREHLTRLIDIVKKPIDGSAENINRGKIVESSAEKIIGYITNGFSDDEENEEIQVNSDSTDFEIEIDGGE